MNISFFAIHCDDVERARAFYGAVFDWRFEAWGPPGFYLVHTGTDDDPGIPGAIQERHEHGAGAGGAGGGFECTIGVDDLAAVKHRLVAHGAKVLYDEVEIETVGTLVQFLDTEGNVCNAMKYLDQPH
jgi:predicted enzyme related to lactoylglutathione lyase